MRINVNVPESLSEINLEQYQMYLKIQSNEKDETFLASKMLELFCGVSFSDAYKMKMSDVTAITDMLADLFEQKPALVKRFKMNGIEYGFIPNLDEMTFGEYVDLDTYLGDWENMHKAMNVLYRPVTKKYGEKYSIKDYADTNSEVMKGMPLDAVLGSVLFFYRLGRDLSQTMMNYLVEGKEQRLVQYLSSQQNGVGINHSIHSLMGILQDLKISLN